MIIPTPSRRVAAGARGGRNAPLRVRAIFALAAAAAASGLSGCGHAEAKAYDISPIFPLSSGKCAKYGGTQQGSGVMARCLVTKSQCEQAASDWKQAMQSSGVNDAVLFSCD